MKRITSLVLVLLFVISSLQVCFAGYSNYYDQTVYGYNPYGTGTPYPGTVDQAQPAIIINTVSPTFDPKFSPSVNASSQGSKDYSGIANIVKWLAIIGGGTFLYFKYREGIENFLAGLAPTVQATLTSWLNALQAQQQATQVAWYAQLLGWGTFIISSILPMVGGTVEKAF